MPVEPLEPRPTGAAPETVRAEAAVAAPGGDLRADVVEMLRRRGLDDDAAVVEVLTAIGNGYGPAEVPAWLTFDVNRALADEVVHRYETGARSPDPDRAMHRSVVRAMVVSNLELLHVDDVDDAQRDALTAFCLGSWDPATMAHAERDAIPSFVVRWYRDGR